MAEGQTTSFMISSGSDFTVQGTIVPEPIPEPSAILLTGLTILSVGVHARRRGRR